MRIHIYGICWNEVMIMPYWCRHYQQFAEKIVIYDNMSTDGSADIARLMGIEVRVYNTNNEIRDDIYQQIKSKALNEAKGKCDWVIVVDMDELIWFDNAERILQTATTKGYNVIVPSGYDLVSDKIPIHDGQLYEHPDFQLAAPAGAKPCVINPNAFKAKLGFSVGAHSLTTPGQKIWHQPKGVKYIHCKHIGGENALVLRYAQYRNRLSQRNRKHKWGVHYLQSEAEIRNQYQTIKLNAEPLFFKPSESALKEHIQTFIICHNQELVLSNLSRFEWCENAIWLFVGDAQTDKLIDIPNLIICRNLEYNIEQHKELLHYTAIYAIIHNKLIKDSTKWIRFYEYDVTFDYDYQEESLGVMESTGALIIGHRHAAHPQHDKTQILLDQPAYLIEIIANSIYDTYGVDCWKVIPLFKEWMCSINFVMQTSFLIAWFNWFEPMLKNFIGQRQAGNNIERSFSLFCFTNSIEFIKIDGLHHEYRNSHGTS